MSAETQQQASQAVKNRLYTHPALRGAHHIACYSPCFGELSLMPFIQASWSTHALYLPVVGSLGSLCFFRYFSHTRLKKNRYGILEPPCDEQMPLGPQTVILVPLVAFDSAYSRLGRGGGYYDRFLASVHSLQMQNVGVGHLCQQVDLPLPVHAGDYALGSVVTPDHIGYRSSQT